MFLITERRLFLFFLVITLLILLGCGGSQSQPTETSSVTEELPEPEEEQVAESLPEPVSCEYSSDCEQGLLCIDKECKTLASLYKTDCENKCDITGVKVKTSDGEDYNLLLGQGSYTAAGALEWKLLKTPDYCQGENPLVAVNLIKKTTGKLFGEQVFTLHKGDTSEVVTHPKVKSVKFTVTLVDATEECS